MAEKVQIIPLTGADKDVRRVIIEALSTEGETPAPGNATQRISVIIAEHGNDPLGQHGHDYEETFLLAKGSARFHFKYLATGEEFSQVVDAFTMVRIPAGVAHTVVTLSDIMLISFTNHSYEDLGSTRHELV